MLSHPLLCQPFAISFFTQAETSSLDGGGSPLGDLKALPRVVVGGPSLKISPDISLTLVALAGKRWQSLRAARRAREAMLVSHQEEQPATSCRSESSNKSLVVLDRSLGW